MPKLEDLITAYRKRFKDDPPLMGVEKKDLARRIREALKTGRPISLKELGVPDEAYVSATAPAWTWQEGHFDPMPEPQHKINWLELYFVPNPQDLDEAFAFLVAYVAESQKEGVLTVRLMPENLPDTVEPGPIVQRIRQEIDSFLSQEKDPMKYLRYRASTVSNIYSQLQWAYKIFDPVDPPVR